MPSADQAREIVTVFGGTGFLGRRIVRRLLDRGVPVRAVSRHPDIAEGAEPFTADIRDEAAVAAALEGARAAVNAVSLYRQRGRDTYRALHVEAAARLAAQAREAGVARLVQLSGIGADPASPDAYIAARGAGEQIVRAAFPKAIILRPSALFAEDGGLVLSLLRLLRALPVFPLFGTGETRLQPIHADDVAEAAARVLDPATTPAPLYELGGPEPWRYADLLRHLAAKADVRARLLPVPFALWHGLATATERLPNAPLTRAMVALMRHDNVVSLDLPGLPDLGIAPRGIDDVVPDVLRRLGTHAPAERDPKQRNRP